MTMDIIQTLLVGCSGPKKGRFVCEVQQNMPVYLAFWVFLGRSTAWMLGSTPPWAMVTPDRSLFNSSSLRIANCK